MTVPAITKNLMAYLSVQLMHGSMVKTKTGTSARLAPGNVFNNAGIFAKVGVRMRSR
jgi:hypothetical protein